MLEFILKDGSKLEMPEGCKIEEVAQKISAGLARASLAARLDGEIVEMNHVADKGGKIEFLTFEDEDGRKVYRHTASHVLAQAVKRLYPNTKLAIGPAIDNGFYYDFDTEIPFTADVLEKLEAEMKKIIKEDLPLVRSVKPREEAVKYMEQKGRALQGRAYQRPAGGQRGLVLHPRRFHRLMRRPAPCLHRQIKGHQAHLLHRCILARQ